MTSSLDLFNAGQLLDATQAAIGAVREAPTDVDQRWMLATLFCFNGDFDRADKHLQTILAAAPDLAAEVLLFRNLLRGEIARRQCFEEGRVPAFPESPSESHQLLLRALALEIGGEPETAVSLVQQVSNGLPALSGQCNQQSFEGFRDWDDFLASIVEVITVNGDYYWLGIEQIREIRFDPIVEMRDMLWRNAEITTSDGATLAAYFPVLYPGSADDADEAIRLGRAADWVEKPAGVLRGKGVRSFEIGGETLPLSQIDTLRLSVSSKS
jgi:type VI secretion system protein ImpE